ncbi:MAG: hypothetical protein Q7R52_01455 [archaeon]|nr:hypothetical protein [archaeon]
MKFDNIKIVKIISLIVAFVAILVIIGWLFNIEFLKIIIPNVTAMRFLTAIAFLGCGLMLYSLAKIKENKSGSTSYMIHLLFASFFILLLMVISFFNVLGVNFNLEEMINYNYVDHAKTFPISVPSISTMFLFLLISFTGFMNIFCNICVRKLTKIVGFVTSIIATIVILGYILGIPLLYFAIPGISNAMAIHTAFLFLIIGIAFILLSNKDSSDKSFTTRYTIQQKLIIGFSLLIGLTIIMASVTSIIIRENNINLKNIKEIESPLEIMVEQVSGYDALLTGHAHAALLHSIKGDSAGLTEHKKKYDEAGVKLDNLLKYQARDLLAKSQRGTDDKQLIYGYLDKLNKINLQLVDLETQAFTAMENGDNDKAYSLIVSDQYADYKNQLADYYQKWADEETRISDLYKIKNLNNLKYIFWANLILALIVIIIGIIMARFITNSIVKPLIKLEDVAKNISSGNINVKISSESKRMPGIIGNIANSFDKLFESSQFALKTLVESKMAMNKRESIVTGREIRETRATGRENKLKK